MRSPDDARAKIIPGDLFKSPESGWCRHGLALAHEWNGGQVVLLDTYWGSSSDNSRVWKPEEIDDRFTFIINLNECKRTSREVWETYRDEDRAHIPMGGGGERWFVRVAAEPDPERKRQQLVWDVEKAKSALEGAKWNLNWAEKELEEFDKKAGIA